MKANAIRLYKNACEMAENPKGIDSLERTNVKNKAIKNKAMWEERFKTSKKYREDPQIQALIGTAKPKKEKKDDKGRDESA